MIRARSPFPTQTGVPAVTSDSTSHPAPCADPLCEPCMNWRGHVACMDQMDAMPPPGEAPTPAEPILTPRQWRYLIWLGVSLVLAVAARLGLAPVASPIPAPPPGWEELRADVKAIKAAQVQILKQ